MLCASSKDALKNALQGIRNHLQATCKSDLDLAAIISDKTKSKQNNKLRLKSTH